MTLYCDSSWKYYKYVTSSWSQPANPSGISSTSGWSNPSLSFDKNSETYSSCGTSSDYIEWNLGTEILLSGMSATGNYIGSVARYCNVSIYKVNDDGSETLLGNGSGGSESATYTSSVSFSAVWVKRLRFRLIAGYSEPTTSYPTRIREITLTATQQRTVVETTKEDSDYAVYAGKKIRDRGANSGSFYAGNRVKNTTVTGGWEKHFSIPSKITLDDNGLSNENECWRIAFKFKLPNVTSDQRLFGVVATPCPGVVIGVLNGKLNYWLSSDGVNWDIASRAVGATTLVANKIYTVHFKRYNVSGVPFYRSSIRRDGESWATDIDINNTTPIKSGFYYDLGRDWAIFTQSAVFYLDGDTYIQKWNADGTITRLWSSVSDGVVPVTGIKKAYLPNFIKTIGSPSLSGGVGSGFTVNNYFSVASAWQGLSTASNWEMVLKVTTGSDVDSQQYIMVGEGTNNRDVVVALVNKSWLIQMSSNGTSYDICNTTWLDGEILPNTTYWILVNYNIRANYYTCKISYDGINFSRNLNIGVADNRKVISNSSHAFGAVAGASDWYWRGSIDFNGCYLNINGNRVWDSTKGVLNNLVYNLLPYTPSQIIYELGNPSSTITSDKIPIYATGVVKCWIVGGGNGYRWCYIGCNYSAGAAGFIGKMKFNTQCYLRAIVGAQMGTSKLQVASWDDPNTWYDLISATSSTDDWSADPRYSPGTISVNRDSTFNNYFDIELEANGNNGSQSGYGASVYGGYGSGGTNGYVKLMYAGEN